MLHPPSQRGRVARAAAAHPNLRRHLHRSREARQLAEEHQCLGHRVRHRTCLGNQGPRQPELSAFFEKHGFDRDMRLRQAISARGSAMRRYCGGLSSFRSESWKIRWSSALASFTAGQNERPSRSDLATYPSFGARPFCGFPRRPGAGGPGPLHWRAQADAGRPLRPLFRRRRRTGGGSWMP